MSLEPAGIQRLSHGHPGRADAGRRWRLELQFMSGRVFARSLCHPAASNRCFTFIAQLLWKRYDPLWPHIYTYVQLTAAEAVRDLKDVTSLSKNYITLRESA